MRLVIAAAALGIAHLGRIDASAALVNEFHYDNDGSDEGEFIEILLAPGEDITDFNVVLYNGSDSETYGSTVNSGDFVPGELNVEGFQVFSAAVSGLQNGAPDGFALVNTSGGSAAVENSGGVPQFLSYEGVLTAADGVANGMTATDVGVSESGSTLVGHSLSLVGTGETYSDFSWSSPSAATPGFFNTSQTVTPTGSATAAPEPGSAVALLGLAGVAVVRRWRRQQRQAAAI